MPARIAAPGGRKLDDADGPSPPPLPSSFELLGRIGKGGFGVVWRVRRLSDGVELALKHFRQSSKRSIATAACEERAASLLAARRQLAEADELRGLNSVPRLVKRFSSKRHLLLIYELGGTCLSKLLCHVRGVFRDRGRIYEISPGPALTSMMTPGLAAFRCLCRGLLRALVALQGAGLVHGDLKPDNILLDCPEGGSVDFSSVRLVDFGSSYEYAPSQPERGAASSTPEYLPPESLHGMVASANLKRSRRRSGGIIEVMSGYIERAESTPYSFDAWCLGACLLEVAAGHPIWFPMPMVSGAVRLRSGIFAVQGRHEERILEKQLYFLSEPKRTLAQCPGIGLDKDECGLDFLLGLMSLKPTDRLSPAEALLHPFILSQGEPQLDNN